MVLGGAAPFLTLCLILEKTRFGSRAAAEPVRILRSPDVTVTVTASTPRGPGRVACASNTAGPPTQAAFITLTGRMPVRWGH
jgi:hypothetical protein